MKNKNTKLKAMLFVVFMASMALVGTMPMIMGDSTDGGGGGGGSGGTFYRRYATNTYLDLDGDLTGSMATSGSSSFRIAPYGACDISSLKWVYEFTPSTTKTAEVKYNRQWNMKGYSSGNIIVSYSLVLIKKSTSEVLLSRNNVYISKSSGGTATTTGSETGIHIVDRFGELTTATVYAGITYQIRYTIGIAVFNGYLHHSTSSSSNAYSNYQIYMSMY